MTSGPHTDLLAAARARGVPDAEGVAARLARYLLAVLAAPLNLTGAKDLDGAVRAIGESAFGVAPAWGRPVPPRLVVDYGSGNGLPGVVAALLWPEAEVLLVERRARKASALQPCLEAAGIANARPVAADAQELPRARPEIRGRVDLVTVRAVGPLAEPTRVAAPWLRRGGRIAHWKGTGLTAEEEAEGRIAAEAAGLRVLPSLRFADRFGPAVIVLYERP